MQAIRHCRILERMHTVVETPEYLRDAKRAGLSREECEAIVAFMAARPQADDEIRGTGGARKVRFAAKGKGKSGGVQKDFEPTG